MDIISHGLWGGVAFGRKSKKSFLMSFLLGIGPDLFAFGPYFIGVLLGLEKLPDFSTKSPDPSMLDSYVYKLYSISHSLIIFSAVFTLLWLIFKKPVWEFSAWGLHLLMDIPTHSHQFFPTPFLWPISNFSINGRPWATPEILIPDILALSMLYYYFYIRPRNKKE